VRQEDLPVRAPNDVYRCILCRGHRGKYHHIVVGDNIIEIPKLTPGRPLSEDPRDDVLYVRLSHDESQSIDNVRGDMPRAETVRRLVGIALKHPALVTKALAK